MLSLLLLLTSPQMAIPPRPPAPTTGPQDTLRVLGQSQPGCASLVTPAQDSTQGDGLLWREGADRVGHYLLLDRRVNGCPDPILVNYRVPGSNAVGRELGLAPAPLPAEAPRP